MLRPVLLAPFPWLAFSESTNKYIRACHICRITWWFRQQRVYLQCRRPRFDPWVGKIPWWREGQPTLVFLPGEAHGQRSLVDYNQWECKGSDTTERLALSLHVTHTCTYVCVYMTRVFMYMCHNICLYAYTHTTWEEHKVSLWFWYSKPLHYTSSCSSLGDRHIHSFVLWCYFRSSHTHFQIKRSSHDLIWCWDQPWEAGRSCVLLAVKWLIPGESTPWSRAQTRTAQPFTVASEYWSAVLLVDSR